MANTIVKVPFLAKETIRLLDRKIRVLPWANRDFEGELKQQGDTVSVQTFPNIEWSATDGTTTAGDSIAESNFVITSENLVINKLKQINVPIKDIEEIQSNLALQSKVADRLAYDLARQLDNDVVALAVAGAGSVLGDAAVALTASTVFQALLSMHTAVKNNNAGDNAVCFVSPAISALLIDSGKLDNTDKGLQMRIEGYVGRMLGITIIETTATQIVGTTDGLMVLMDMNSVNHVTQMDKMKATDATDAFKMNILGEVLTGGKVFTENAKRIATYAYLN